MQGWKPLQGMESKKKKKKEQEKDEKHVGKPFRKNLKMKGVHNSRLKAI